MSFFHWLTSFKVIGSEVNTGNFPLFSSLYLAMDSNVATTRIMPLCNAVSCPSVITSFFRFRLPTSFDSCCNMGIAWKRVSNSFKFYFVLSSNYLCLASSTFSANHWAVPLMYLFQILPVVVTPNENLNIFSSATSSLASCLFVSAIFCKSHIKAGFNTNL